MDICECVTESLCCIPEINVTLFVNYTSIENKNVKKLIFYNNKSKRHNLVFINIIIVYLIICLNHLFFNDYWTLFKSHKCKIHIQPGEDQRIIWRALWKLGFELNKIIPIILYMCLACLFIFYWGVIHNYNTCSSVQHWVRIFPYYGKIWPNFLANPTYSQVCAAITTNFRTFSSP